MAIDSFNQFVNKLNESWDDVKMGVPKNGAGVLIKWRDSILLVHPTNASWKSAGYGIPKGGIEESEDPMTAALRELREETGISLTPDKLNPDPYVVHKHNKSGTLKMQLIYFEAYIEDLSEIGLTEPRVPKEQLQLEEIDWAGFIPISESYPKIHAYQRIILDRIN